MEDEILQSPVLEASLSNPDDPFEMTIVGNAASVGITDELFKSGKRIKWDADQLEQYASTLKDMPITLEFQDPDTGAMVDHSSVIVGRVKDVFFDKAKNAVSYVGQLYKHYFPETLERLAELHASDKKPETSWEFVPTGLKQLPEDGENVWTPTGGRFGGLAIVNRGADRGSQIALLAAAAKKEQSELADKQKAEPRVGSFEWLGSKIAERLTASTNVDNFIPATILETYPDHAIYLQDGKHFKMEYTIEGTNLEFSDTIEVEPVYQPLGASAAGSTSEPPEVPPTPIEEAQEPVDEKELEALKASAAKVPDLESENTDLKAEIETLKASNTELENYKKTTEEEKAAAALETLAASRLAEVEKIAPYKDEKQKKEDLEAFKTMDEKSFDIVKRTLVAAAEARGGISSDERVEVPESREDGDGKAREILESDDFKALLASVKGESTSKEDK